ncbi:MAG TPA: hypothetical protein VK797_03870, partial [Tepidisphaeraceae bacterium]|nr:hypothetical protein [Tepidisphaeraceae bacterium]
LGGEKRRGVVRNSAMNRVPESHAQKQPGFKLLDHSAPQSRRAGAQQTRLHTNTSSLFEPADMPTLTDQPLL